MHSTGCVAIDAMHDVEGQKVNGFLMTVVPLGNSKLDSTWPSEVWCASCLKTENHVKFVLGGPHTSYTPYPTCKLCKYYHIVCSEGTSHF